MRQPNLNGGGDYSELEWYTACHAIGFIVIPVQASDIHVIEPPENKDRGYRCIVVYDNDRYQPVVLTYTSRDRDSRETVFKWERGSDDNPMLRGARKVLHALKAKKNAEEAKKNAEKAKKNAEKAEPSVLR